jgi:hypothetical protein
MRKLILPSLFLLAISLQSFSLIVTPGCEMEAARAVQATEDAGYEYGSTQEKEDDYNWYKDRCNAAVSASLTPA